MFCPAQDLSGKMLHRGIKWYDKILLEGILFHFQESSNACIFDWIYKNMPDMWHMCESGIIHSHLHRHNFDRRRQPRSGTLRLLCEKIQH